MAIKTHSSLIPMANHPVLTDWKSFWRKRPSRGVVIENVFKDIHRFAVIIACFFYFSNLETKP
jgi:hypothetical protein